MDDKLFEEIIQEIDTMSSEEYWSLYREAESLTDFPPEDLNFIPVHFVNIPISNFSDKFNNTFVVEDITISDNYCQETFLYGDDVWLRAA